jgi:ABC-type nitrate/sulfonate/bicarbonate transport system ATPase subunit
VELRDLTVAFGDKVVFDHRDFFFSDRGLTMLMGPSGVGKTTLLRAVLKQYPDSGFLFQEDRLFPGRTVLQHLLDVMDKPDRDKAEELLELVELTGEEASYPASLSGGMARRLALARCLALGSPRFLLDEPFTGVDEVRQRRLLARLKALGRPVVLSTHHQGLLEYADAVVAL